MTSSLTVENFNSSSESSFVFSKEEFEKLPFKDINDLIRFLANINGSFFNKNSDLEGMFFANVLDYIKCVLIKIHSSDPQKIEICIHKIEMMQFFNTKINHLNDLSIKGMNHEEKAFHELSEEMLNLFREKKYLLLGAGWSAVSGIGHKLLLEIILEENNTVTLHIINTGNGLKYHQTRIVEGKLKFSPYFSFTNIKLDKISHCFFFQLLNYLKLPSDTFTLPGQDEDFIGSMGDVFYGFIISYFSKDLIDYQKREDDFFISAQSSGNCGYTCILPLLKESFNDSILYLKTKTYIKINLLWVFLFYTKYNRNVLETRNGYYLIEHCVQKLAIEKWRHQDSLQEAEATVIKICRSFYRNFPPPSFFKHIPFKYFVGDTTWKVSYFFTPDRYYPDKNLTLKFFENINFNNAYDLFNYLNYVDVNLNYISDVNSKNQFYLYFLQTLPSLDVWKAISWDIESIDKVTEILENIILDHFTISKDQNFSNVIYGMYLNCVLEILFKRTGQLFGKKYLFDNYSFINIDFFSLQKERSSETLDELSQKLLNDINHYCRENLNKINFVGVVKYLYTCGRNQLCVQINKKDLKIIKFLHSLLDAENLSFLEDVKKIFIKNIDNALCKKLHNFLNVYIFIFYGMDEVEFVVSKSSNSKEIIVDIESSTVSEVTELIKIADDKKAYPLDYLTGCVLVNTYFNHPEDFFIQEKRDALIQTLLTYDIKNEFGTGLRYELTVKNSAKFSDRLRSFLLTVLNRALLLGDAKAIYVITQIEFIFHKELQITKNNSIESIVKPKDLLLQLKSIGVLNKDAYYLVNSLFITIKYNKEHLKKWYYYIQLIRVFINYVDIENPLKLHIDNYCLENSDLIESLNNQFSFVQLEYIKAKILSFFGDLDFKVDVDLNGGFLQLEGSRLKNFEHTIKKQYKLPRSLSFVLKKDCYINEEHGFTIAPGISENKLFIKGIHVLDKIQSLGLSDSINQIIFQENFLWIKLALNNSTTQNFKNSYLSKKLPEEYLNFEDCFLLKLNEDNHIYFLDQTKQEAVYIKINSKGTQIQDIKKGQFLVCYGDTKVYKNYLACLNMHLAPKEIQIWVDGIDHVCKIKLLNFNLSFRLEGENELYSLQYPGFKVDFNNPQPFKGSFASILLIDSKGNQKLILSADIIYSNDEVDRCNYLFQIYIYPKLLASHYVVLERSFFSTEVDVYKGFTGQLEDTLLLSYYFYVLKQYKQSLYYLKRSVTSIQPNEAVKNNLRLFLNYYYIAREDKNFTTDPNAIAITLWAYIFYLKQEDLKNKHLISKIINEYVKQYDNISEEYHITDLYLLELYAYLKNKNCNALNVLYQLLIKLDKKHRFSTVKYIDFGLWLPSFNFDNLRINLQYANKAKLSHLINDSLPIHDVKDEIARLSFYILQFFYAYADKNRESLFFIKQIAILYSHNLINLCETVQSLGFCLLAITSIEELDWLNFNKDILINNQNNLLYLSLYLTEIILAHKNKIKESYLRLHDHINKFNKTLISSQKEITRKRELRLEDYRHYAKQLDSYIKKVQLPLKTTKPLSNKQCTKKIKTCDEDTPFMHIVEMLRKGQDLNPIAALLEKELQNHIEKWKIKQVETTKYLQNYLQACLTNDPYQEIALFAKKRKPLDIHNFIDWLGLQDVNDHLSFNHQEIKRIGISYLVAHLQLRQLEQSLCFLSDFFSAADEQKKLIFAEVKKILELSFTIEDNFSLIKCCFEYKLNVLLKKEQVLFFNLVRQSTFCLFQLPCGFGKSKILSPLLNHLFHYQNKLVLNLAPSFVLEETGKNITMAIARVKGSIGELLVVKRSSFADVASLKFFYKKLKLAHEHKLPLTLDPNSLQSIFLNYIEILYKLDKNKDASLTAQLLIYEKALNLIIENGVGILDEVHVIANSLQSLIYNLGEIAEIEPFRAKITLCIYKNLTAANSKKSKSLKWIKSIWQDLQLLDPDFTSLEWDFFKRYIQADVKKSPANELSYLKNEESLLSKDLIKKMRYLRAQIKVFIKNTKNKRCYVDFGPIAESNEVIPYRGNMLPETDSKFEHYDILINLNIQLYLKIGLNPAQVKQVILRWIELSKYQSKFKELFKKYFSEYELEWIYASSEEKIEEFSKKATHCNELIFFYLEEFVLPSIKVEKYKLASYSSDILMMLLKNSVSFTGTKGHSSLYPLKIETYMDLDADTDILKILNDPSITRLNFYNKLNLKTILNTSKVLLDPDAYFVGKKNEEIAKKILKYTSEQIEKVVFYDSRTNVLSLMDRQGNVKEFHQNLENPAKYFVYLDHNHCTGTDIQYAFNVTGSLIVNKNLTKTALIQATKRLRELGKGQKLDLILTNSLKEDIEKKYNVTEMTIETLLDWCQKNEERSEKLKIYQGLVNQLKTIYREAAFKILIKEEDVESKTKLFKSCRSLFIEEINHEDYMSIGSLEEPPSLLNQFERLQAHLAKAILVLKTPIDHHLIWEIKKKVEELDSQDNAILSHLNTTSRQIKHSELQLQDQHQLKKENFEETTNNWTLFFCSTYFYNLMNQTLLIKQLRDRLEPLGLISLKQIFQKIPFDLSILHTANSLEITCNIGEYSCSYDLPLNIETKYPTKNKEIKYFMEIVSLKHKMQKRYIILTEKEARKLRKWFVTQTLSQSFTDKYNVTLCDINGNRWNYLKDVNTPLDLSILAQIQFLNGYVNYTEEVFEALKKWILTFAGEIEALETLFYQLNKKTWTFKGSQLECLFKEIKNQHMQL